MWNIDPSPFDDPIAFNTSWDPIDVTSPILFPREVVEQDDNSLIIGVSKFRKVLSIALLIVAMYLVFALTNGSLITLSVGIILLIIASYFFFNNSLPVVIKANDRVLEISKGTSTQTIEFDDIHALQIIPFFAFGKKNTEDFVDQINAITLDGERIHLFTTTDEHSAHTASVTISNLVGAKVWDATSFY